jgi:hypothetical protein
MLESIVQSLYAIVLLVLTGSRLNTFRDLYVLYFKDYSLSIEFY